MLHCFLPMILASYKLHVILVSKRNTYWRWGIYFMLWYGIQKIHKLALIQSTVRSFRNESSRRKHWWMQFTPSFRSFLTISGTFNRYPICKVNIYVNAQLTINSCRHQFMLGQQPVSTQLFLPILPKQLITKAGGELTTLGFQTAVFVLIKSIK